MSEKRPNTHPAAIVNKPVTRRAALAGAASAAGLLAMPHVARAESAALKVGVVLPMSGPMAAIGQSILRGHEIAVDVLKQVGYPPLEIVVADTETKVDIARTQAVKLVKDGITVMTGAFDSGQTAAVAQVAEQQRVPFVINIAAADQITEQGYKYVFRSFPKSSLIARQGYDLQKEVFKTTGVAPKSAVLLHVNDTFGTGIAAAIVKFTPKMNVPYRLLDSIAYNPLAPDLSVEVAKAKATGADMLWVISRLNDAILITRELVKQRWTPMGIWSTGPGWNEEQYMKVLGKYGDYPVCVAPWYDPHKPMSKRMEAAFSKKYPDLNVNMNVSYAFEAMLTIADAFKRAASTDAAKLTEAIRTCDVKDNVTLADSIKFGPDGQNPTAGCAATQNVKGRLVVVAPARAKTGNVVWPIPEWSKRK